MLSSFYTRGHWNSKMISDFIQFSFYCKLPCQNKGSHTLLHACALSFLPLHLSLIFHRSFSPSNDWLSFEHKINCHRFFPNNPWECISVFTCRAPREQAPQSQRKADLPLNECPPLGSKEHRLSRLYLDQNFFLHFPAVCPWLVFLICELWITAFTVKCCWDDCPSPLFFLGLLANIWSFLSFFNLLHWRIVDLQGCVNFCYTANCLSCMIWISIHTIHFFILCSIMVYHRILNTVPCAIE